MFLEKSWKQELKYLINYLVNYAEEYALNGNIVKKERCLNSATRFI